MSKNIGKNIGRNFSSKYGQKPLDHAKQSITDVLWNTLKRAIPNSAEATGDLIGNKIADKITKVSKIPQNSLGRVKNETEYIGFARKIPKERNISRKMEEIIDDLRLI